uniref:Si:dkey-25g12.4 n=1 Tax=Scleropages formosus TaxID=113540 RepID=A0A8C9RMC4_SCLFO
MSGASGRASLPRIPPTKTIVMYRNGDAFFPPRKVVVNQRHVATFDRFLSAATRAVQAPFGAVRNVYTPLQGHRVVDLERLRHGEGYVAAGAERFKHLDHVTAFLQIHPVVHSRIVASSRWKKAVNESCTINVFTNGDVLVPPARILIPKYTLKNWESVLALVTQKVHLRTGAVHRLCTLDGTPLLGSIELENYQYYVAVGAERFRFLPYYHQFHSSGTEMGGWHEQMSRPPVRYNSHRDTTPPPPPPHDLSLYLDGNIFMAKSRRKEMMGAMEVQEDGRMKVDLPIDQLMHNCCLCCKVNTHTHTHTHFQNRLSHTGSRGTGAYPVTQGVRPEGEGTHPGRDASPSQGTPSGTRTPDPPESRTVVQPTAPPHPRAK